MSNSFAPTALALAMAQLWALPAFAQSTPTDKTLAPVLVVDSALSNTQPGIAESKAQLRLIPGGTSVVDLKDVQEGRNSTWRDSLGLAPGVFIQDRFGSEEARISIRGSALSRTFHSFGIRMMQDGIPVNYADGFFDMQTIDPTAASHVEVLRGANALSVGAATLGGAINYVSPTGYTADRLSLRGELGSYDYRRGQVSSGQVLGSTQEGGPVWDYYANFSANSQGGYRDYSDQSSQKLTANLGVKINPRLEARLFVSAVDSESHLPGYLTRTQLEQTPRMANPLNTREDFQRRDINAQRVALKTSYALDQGRLEVSAYGTHHLLYHPISFGLIEQETNTNGLSLKYEQNGRLLGLPNTVAVGYLPSWGLTSTLSGPVSVVSSGMLNNNPLSRLSINQNSTGSAQNHAVFVEDRLSLTPTRQLIASLQYDNARRHNQDGAGSASAQYDRTYEAVSPRIGLIEEFRPGHQFFGNISRNFEAPIFGVATDMQASKAQTGTTLELGLRGEQTGADKTVFGDRTSYELVVYRTLLRNEFQTSCVDAPACTMPTKTVNLPKTLHQGVELGGDAYWKLSGQAAGLQLKTSLLYSQFEFRNNPLYGNNTLPGFPELLARAELLMRWGQVRNGLPVYYAGPTTELASRAAMDNTNSLYNAGYALLGFKAGGAFGDGWAWFLDGRNLLDKRYAGTTNISANYNGGAPTAKEPGGPAAYYPGEGRSVFVGLSKSWK